MANILMITLLVVGALALWFAIGLVVARPLGRVAAMGEHQHRMDLLHREVRLGSTPWATSTGSKAPRGATPSRRTR